MISKDRTQSMEMMGRPHIDWLGRLRKLLNVSGLDLHKLLHRSLGFLSREVVIARASIYMADYNRNIWKECIRLDRDGTLTEGYRHEPIREGGVFGALITGSSEVMVGNIKGSESERHILVRLDMPGDVHYHIGTQLSSMQGVGGIGEFVVAENTDVEPILAWCRELGPRLALSLMEKRLERQSQQIKSFGELSWLFVTSLRLEDRLKLIIAGIQKLFSFDRIRLYLTNTEGSELVGEVEMNIRRELHSLNYERYPIPSGAARGLVELLWNSLRLSSWSRILEYSLAHHDKMLYLPLKIQSKEIGVLVVDNLLSQKPIPEEVRNLLVSFAGQLSLAVDNSRLFSEVEKLSLYDSLSHLPNRRYFDQRLQEEFYRSARANLPFAICLADLDFFKEINDTYGHQVGDQAIARIGGAIKSILRQSDFAARWGGDELALLLGNTNEEDAAVVIERVLAAIRAVRLDYPSDPPKQIKVTASIGIANYPKDAEDIAGLIAEADRALYEVKFRGRDGYLLASKSFMGKN